MTSRLRSRLVDACLLAALAAPALAQDPPPPAPAGGRPPVENPQEPAPEAEKKPGPLVRLTAWPKPANKEALLVDVERLVKMRTEEMGVQAHDALVATGAGAVPFLLERYGKEKDVDVADRMHAVLVELTTAEHTRLLAREFEGKHGPARTFALWRVAAFPDAEVRPAAEAAWARLEKQGAKADPEELYAAALCCAATGSTRGLDALFSAAQNRWDKHGVEIRNALEGCRGPEATKLVLAKLDAADAAKDRKQKVAVLRLLAGAGEASATPRVRWFLDDDDNSVKIAAINALRGIVDRQGPLEQLSAFEAIETAKKWKSRV